MSFTILGTGSALPARAVTNEELTKLVDTSDEWIRTRTGIRERRICTTENLEELAVSAAKKALEDSKISSTELDMILCATISGDYATPSMACIIQAAIGADCPAMDFNAACSGFLYGLDIAAGYFARKPDCRILLVAAESMSRLVDWQDRSTCVLFGDGAGAVVLGPGDDLLAIQLTANGNVGPLYAKNGWGNSPFRLNAESGNNGYLSMNGQEVFKFAVTTMVQSVEQTLVQANLEKSDLAYVLPHQANIRIIDSAMQRLKMPREKCLVNIENHGNTSAACVAILLDESSKAGRFHKGDLLALTAFGGGLTSGACILRWNKE